MAKFNIKKDISLFDFADNQYKITKPIRLIELFAGIGSQAKALKNLNVDFEHHFVCEIEPQVVKTYNVIHGTNFEPTDITKISANDLNITNTDLYTYILTYSFPCQDLSLAGKGKGMEKGTGTRSSLLWEVERLLKECNELPQILLMENVPMVHSSENIKDFEKWLLFLESLGYKNYWKDLNAKNYGIPQNRDRCYMISLLNSNCDYTFPQPIKLKLRLKDMLEEKVDEKYFLSESMLKFFSENSEKNKLKGNGFRFKPVNKNKAEIAKTLTTRCGSKMDDNFIVDNEKVTRLGGFFDKNGIKHQAGSAYDINALSPIIDTMQGGYRQPCIVVKNATKKGYVEAYEGDGIYIDRPHQKGGVVQKDMIQTIKCNCNDVGVVVLGNYSPSKHNASRIVDNSGIAPTVMENHGTVTATVVAAAQRGRGEGWKQEIEVSDREVVVNDKPRKDIKELDKTCEYCGKQLERKRFNGRLEDFTVFSNRKYCNRECMKRDFLKIGEHDQSYSNAHTTARKINELILHKETCELCGNDTNLDIHHIDGNWQNNNLDNLMCLCRSCHTKYERNKDKNELRIRKLTPLEVWRLMGFSDDDFDKAEKINSNSQLYKQAGNSIVVNVLMAIFKQFLN